MLKGVSVSPQHNAKFSPSTGGLDSDEEKSPVRCVSTYSLVNPEERHDAWKKFNSHQELLKDFCYRTSSHGIPHIGQSRTLAGKLFWTVIFITCSIAFYYQTYWTIHRFVQYNTIIEMELKFEAAPFPAVTLCNLNAYKYSRAQSIPDMQMTLAHFKQKVSGKKEPQKDSTDELSSKEEQLHSVGETEIISELDENIQLLKRERRQSKQEENHYEYHRPVYVHCSCNEKDRGCVKSKTCSHPHETPSAIAINPDVPCLCQKISNLCVQLPLNGEIPAFKFEYNTRKVTTPATTTTTVSAEVVENLGIEEVKDQGTMTTKAKEWLISIGASLPYDIRKNISYSLEDFVLSCSFNSEDCDTERDFNLHVDPLYGNCFTFNYNDSVTLTNSRAGPMYGLRLLVNVNQSDYLPTTEAAGVRMVVHEQDMEAFPDTFGYSAPVGFVSSFGLKTKVISRLGPPYGVCKKDFRPAGYIYSKEYSAEGCYRSCFQRKIVKHCGCGDPRFPVPDGGYACKATKDRQCLKNKTKEFGSYYHVESACDCVQPCEENIFETSYSAAAWPADNCHTYLSSCPEEVNNSKECIEWLRKHTAFIEVFYEQLNFEFLKETEAYTIVNLLSDFGGNIGLWIGFSAITVVECVELMFEFFYFCYYHKRKKTKRKRTQYEMHYVNTLAAEHHSNKMGVMETELG